MSKTTHNTTMKTAGRIGKAWGMFHSDKRFGPELGWTTEKVLDRAKHYAAHDLMKVFLGEPRPKTYAGLDNPRTYHNLSKALANLEQDEYVRYCDLYSRLDRELVKSYYANTK